MSAPVLNAPVIRGDNAVREAQTTLTNERQNARKLAVQSAKSKVQSKTESIERLAKRVKQLKRIGWLIKGITLGTSSIGDVFISLWVLLFWANMELIAFPFFIPRWKQEWWEKAFTIILDLVVFSVISLIVGMVFYFYYNPDVACKVLGPAVAGPLLGFLGLVGGCDLVGGVAKWIMQSTQ